MAKVPGAADYQESAATAEALFARYEQLDFDTLYGPVLNLIPPAPKRVLDIGAGSGRDAGALARRGHSVVAVEPTDALRAQAQDKHGTQAITWVDDGLPALASLSEPDGSFDLVLMNAVLMHLDVDDRAAAIARVGGLLRVNGRLILSLREGPLPEGRAVHAVDPEGVIAAARAVGLDLIYQDRYAAMASDPEDVSWLRLAFSKSDDSDRPS